ncbi:Method: conceptual translation supplied by author [Gymnopus androsaceus JB14]|uniref:Method: conceptual translation supplied by author n=1 Tax=Gymnopus androsaceus JB14 TaxID=1447944 RepID=A0A6A4GGD9_9AGAR|nr:Method: conceptual translation supplied by author [Gymnopus androsaceus JB14]
MMKKVNVPYFKDVLIMSTNCDRCRYRDNEVKSGAAISEQGKRMILKVEDSEDLSRDILKSETAGLTIPEIDLVLTHGTFGGRFTTLEEILEQVYEELSEKIFLEIAPRAP